MDIVRNITIKCTKALIIGIIYVLSHSRVNSLIIKQEVCLPDTFNATCRSGTVIVMKSALFGRMKFNHCISVEIGRQGCKRSVLGYMDDKCSGRSTCEVKVTDLVVQKLSSCHKDVASYLEVSYDCTPVNVVQQHACIRNRPVPVTESTGYLSSFQAENTNVGTISCPWRINVEPGQLVNITVIDFGIWARRKESLSDRAIYCDKYAVLSERMISQDTPICAGEDRVRNIYISKTSTVDVTLIPSSRGESRHFLLQYEVVGCREYQPEPNTHVKISGSNALVTCEATHETWQMKCINGEWQGNTLNCIADNSPTALASLFGENWTSTQGILMVITLGVVLGVLIGLFLLLVSLLCLRKRGWQMPCGLTSQQHHIQSRTLPTRPQYDCKYAQGVEKVHSDPLLQSERTFVDPETGALYDGYTSGGRTIVIAGDGPESGSYKINRPIGPCSHLYECPDFEHPQPNRIITEHGGKDGR